MGEDLNDERVIRALAHPLRRRILLELDEGIASPKEIADRLGEAIPNVSYHVSILRDLGLIELKGTTPRRGAVEHHYAARPRRRLSPKTAAALPAQARDSVSRAAWKTLAGTAGDDQGVVQARDLKVDAKGEKELIDAFDQLWSTLDRIEAASAKRLAKQAEPGVTLTVGVVSGRAAAPARRGRARASAPAKGRASKR